MTLKLTKGMDGKPVQTISESDDIKTLFAAAFDWKKQNSAKYKIERYSRYLFDENSNKLIVDFGDYMYFFLIDGISDWNSVKSAFTYN